jgi:predicted metal-dependent peptidase
MTPTTIRPLTDDERRALAAARLVAVESAPYLAHALFSVRPLAAPGLATFAVDRHWRLYVDPATLDEWGPQVAGAVLVHEASHLIRDHAGRADGLPGPVDHDRWNLATDAAINDDLLRAGLPLPSWVVTPASLGLPDAGVEEAYYGALPAQPPQTEPGCGSGAGDPRQPWEPAGDNPQTPGLDDGQVTITRRKVAQDVRDAVAHGRGTVPAGIERWATDELTAPTVPWRKVLAGMVRRAAALTTGRLTYTYTRPGRRPLPGIVTPAMRAPRVTAAAVVDTSGSMTPDDLAAALREINGVIKAVGGSVSVIACDARAAQARQVRHARDVRLVGGGGTDMTIGIAAAERLTPAPDVIVVLTDGDTPWPSHPTRARLIAVLTREHGLPRVPTWARGILAAPYL